MSFRKLSAILLISTSAFSLPIDWKGSLGFETITINDVRGTNDNCSSDPVLVESQCIRDNNDQNARLQNMIVQLNPTIIVNDSTSVKGELSMGTSRGIGLGEDQVNNQSGSYFSGTHGGSSLNVNQLYAEIYADTAIYRVGKFSKDFGLGAVINSGKNTFDRFYSPANGLEAEFKLGNFSFIPSWSKVSTGTVSGVASHGGRYDVSENSFEISYDNSIKGIEGGVLYTKRTANSSSTIFGGGQKQEAKLLDIYVKKSWEKLSVGLEVPMLSGKAGRVYNSASNQDFDSNSFIIETKYNLNPKWSFDLNVGSVSGASGEADSYEAMYLSPNYHLSKIMFKYNRHGFQNPDLGNANPAASAYKNKNPYASSITNANYVNFNAHYKTANWKWTFSYMMAKANETAKAGKPYYNHERQSYNQAAIAFDQSDDLGSEFDLSFEYNWNPQIVISGYLGYYLVGDYYAFTNTATELSLDNIKSTGLQLSVKF